MPPTGFDTNPIAARFRVLLISGAVTILALAALMLAPQLAHAAGESIYCEDPNYSALCPPTPPPPTPQPVKDPPRVTFAISRRCRSRAFKVTPRFANGTVSRARLQLNGKTIKTLKRSPFRFNVSVKKVKPGRKGRLRLTTTFSTGEVIVKSATFKRCRR